MKVWKWIQSHFWDPYEDDGVAVEGELYPVNIHMWEAIGKMTDPLMVDFVKVEKSDVWKTDIKPWLLRMMSEAAIKLSMSEDRDHDAAATVRISSTIIHEIEQGARTVSDIEAYQKNRAKAQEARRGAYARR